MTEHLNIRRATDADLPALTAMTQAFNGYLDAIDGGVPGSDAEAIAASAMERLRRMAFESNPICTVLMAELNGEPVGYLTYYIGVYMDDATPTVHVADFFVRESFRRRGVGRALMLEARRIAQECGASRLLWTVWSKNEAALRFYTALGAEPEGSSILMQWLT